jgi:two-component system, LytTR family, response regulator
VNVLIVGDQVHARASLVRLCERSDDVQVVGEAACGMAAIDAARTLNPDIMLLDVELPDISGFELLREVGAGTRPLGIMVSRCPDDAKRAFAEGAIDYFVMPVTEERFDLAMVRVRHHLKGALPADSRLQRHALDYVFKPFNSDQGNEALDIAVKRSVQEQAAQILEMLSAKLSIKQLGRIAIKVNGKILLIETTELLTAEAKGNYVLLQKVTGSHLLRETISAVEEQLAPCGFVRVHRSVLVNAAFVESVEQSGGEHIVRMKNGKEYTVARTYKRNLRDLARAWLGFSTP